MKRLRKIRTKQLWIVRILLINFYVYDYKLSTGIWVNQGTAYMMYVLYTIKRKVIYARYEAVKYKDDYIMILGGGIFEMMESN